MTTNIGTELSVFSIVPFAALLLSIALCPLFLAHWWEKNGNKALLAIGCAIPTLILMISGWGEAGFHEISHKLLEYISFICLLGSLYIISSGIFITGSLSGTPLMNTVLLGIGTLIASIVGTTGASMLLIRPLLRANKSRVNRTHIVVFFIFSVSNCGGLLTPLGDPPLFLGFLLGVPFTWTFQLWGQWLLVNTILLFVFNFYDQVVFNREERQREGSQLEEVQKHEPLRVEGLLNVVFLLGITAVIYSAGKGLGNSAKPWPFGIQEGLMLALTALSFYLTPKLIHEANEFTWGPIIEVAVLFIGIFVTMVPALLILNARGAELALNHPWQYFWASGILSSFLDNAPTYVTFAATAAGKFGVGAHGRYLEELLRNPEANRFLAAIACGSVFMGANTYIGNGPNFMVKAIAERAGVKMPSFFRYLQYSGLILLPIFVIVTFVFFR